MRLATRFSALAALLLVSSCAENRYQWSLAHAGVSGRPPLSRVDLEQIIRAVSQATLQPVVSVDRYDTTHVSVIAATSVGYVEEFELQKVGNEWRITSRAEQLDR